MRSAPPGKHGRRAALLLTGKLVFADTFIGTIEQEMIGFL